MLFIVEIIFLVAGVWAIIKGQIPAGPFNALFGRGQYFLPPVQARLFGLFLASPWPVTLGVSILLGALLGARGVGYAFVFEIVYDIAVLVAAVVVARLIRRPLPSAAGGPTAAPAADRRVKNYGARLLIMLGMVVLGLVAVIGACDLMLVGLSTLLVGTASSGSLWSDFWPILLVVVITGLAAFGAFRLFKLLRAASAVSAAGFPPPISPPPDR